MALTGRFRFRKSWFGDLILEVEEDVKPRFKRSLKRRWRNAKLMDLAEPEMRRLLDLRFRPRPSGTAQVLVSSTPTERRETFHPAGSSVHTGVPKDNPQRTTH